MWTTIILTCGVIINLEGGHQEKKIRKTFGENTRNDQNCY